MSKWISVKDKLPKNVTPVLVYGNCCSVCDNVEIAELEDGKWFLSGHGEDLNFEVDYWRKLPKTPINKYYVDGNLYF